MFRFASSGPRAVNKYTRSVGFSALHDYRDQYRADAPLEKLFSIYQFGAELEGVSSRPQQPVDFLDLPPLMDRCLAAAP
jgi:hypothetical protein